MPRETKIAICAPTPARARIRDLGEKVVEITDTRHIPKSEIPNVVIELDAEMRAAAEVLDFERAIQLRDAIKKLEKEMKDLEKGMKVA